MSRGRVHRLQQKRNTSSSFHSAVILKGLGLLEASSTRSRFWFWHDSSASDRVYVSCFLISLLAQLTCQSGYAEYILKADTHAEWIQLRCPYRLPTPKDYRSAIVTAQRISRFDKDPLLAIEILATRNPDAFIG